MSQEIPDWVLERHLAGELPDGFTREQLESDPAVMARLEALRAENAKLLGELPPDQVAREIRWRLAQRTRPRFTAARVMPWVTLAVAATLVAVLIPRVYVVGEEFQTERFKGLAPHLEVYRRVGETTEGLTPGASAFPGDVLQLKIVGAGDRYATVVSIDGAGAVTLHAPLDDGRALALPQAGVQTLDRSYALDAAPRFERFILVTSSSPFEARQVIEAAHALGPDPEQPLRLPEALHQSSFVVRKEGVR